LAFYFSLSLPRSRSAAEVMVVAVDSGAVAVDSAVAA